MSIARHLAGSIKASKRAADDDSPFLSMADFFSLISLTLIYITVSYVRPSALPQDAISVLVTRPSPDNSTNLALAADQTFAFVLLAPDGDALQLSVIGRGQTEPVERSIPLRSPNVEEAAIWISGVLAEGPPPERVVFRMPSNEERPEAHRLLNVLMRGVRHMYPVSVVFPEDQPHG